MALAMMASTPRVEPQELFSEPEVIELAGAACRGDAEVVKRLIEEGVAPDSRGTGDLTSLAYAIYCENIEGVRALVESGADVNLEMNQVYTHAELATHAEKPHILTYLIDSGADVYRTPAKARHNAIAESFNMGFDLGNWASYEYLLEHGIDVNNPIDNTGFDDLATYATKFKHYDRVLDLLDLGYNRDLDKVLKFAELDKAPMTPEKLEFRTELIRRVRKAREIR
ncbi:MAG: hypothetical protein P8J20_14020 [Novosphingobium sp.]|nr:hypothetical protein [Novosphingobium sp.]